VDKLWITCGWGLDNFASKSAERMFSTGSPQVIHRCLLLRSSREKVTAVNNLSEGVEHNEDYQT
jgi:hypothetical protein